MSRRTPFFVVISCLALLTTAIPISVHAQRRGGRPPNPPWHFAVRGHGVFVGGYFCDPHFGPYPWWGPGVYPYWYMPLYSSGGEFRPAAYASTESAGASGSARAADGRIWITGAPRPAGERRRDDRRRTLGDVPGGRVCGSTPGRRIGSRSCPTGMNDSRRRSRCVRARRHR
jgi:hypothetical protein